MREGTVEIVFVGERARDDGGLDGRKTILQIYYMDYCVIMSNFFLFHKKVSRF